VRSIEVQANVTPLPSLKISKVPSVRNLIEPFDIDAKSGSLYIEGVPDMEDAEV
jgi:hypothetical protein